MNNNNLKKLENFINFTQKNKSAHWKSYLNSKSDYYKNNSALGFGAYTTKNFYKKFFHYILSRLVFDNYIFFTNTFKKYKNIFNKDNRQIDVDAIRHIHTFELLKNKISLNKIKKICLIGDGKLNGLIGCFLNFSSSKIYSINLAETLINDYIILKQMNIYKESDIQIVENEDDLNKDKKVYLIPSHLKDFFYKKNIDLFINIASFQEMEMKEIENYFDIIKSNKSLLYCCNRKHKKLPDGKNIFFEKYPWGKGMKLLLENCAWHQKFYLFKFPFIKRYDGNIKHCLIDYGK